MLMSLCLGLGCLGLSIFLFINGLMAVFANFNALSKINFHNKKDTFPLTTYFRVSERVII